LKQVVLWLKLAQCHTAVKSSVDAIRVYQQGISSIFEQALRSCVGFVIFASCDFGESKILLTFNPSHFPPPFAYRMSPLVCVQ
jgi:hypothetical protein